MEELITKMVKYIIEKKYPNLFDGVLVERERMVSSNYKVDEDNYRYSIYLGVKGKLNSTEGAWKIKEEIRDAIHSLGIKNHISIYFKIPS